ncbi:MAG TPA: hypothetical protein ENN67_04185 [Firmicutes bacterium]|nr:hypothetical protein [Bacillota bacterium]
MSNRYRPEGHLLSKEAQLNAKRALLRQHLGPYYLFVQRIAVIPVAYLAIGIVANLREPIHVMVLMGIGALIYSFLYHIFGISFFAARSKIGLDKCEHGSFGFVWSRMFIIRAIVEHILMMSALIWLEPLWFFVSGFILYSIEYFITMTALVSAKGTKTKGKKSAEKRRRKK